MTTPCHPYDVVCQVVAVIIVGNIVAIFVYAWFMVLDDVCRAVKTTWRRFKYWRWVRGL